MAYGDYGAYAWKNGEFIRNYCDTAWVWKKVNKKYRWKLSGERADENEIMAHAVIPIGNALLEFYKGRFMINWGREDGTILIEEVDVEEDILNKVVHTIKDFTISGYTLDVNESIIKYEITHGKDTYCVVVGASFGNGYDTNKKSRFVLKNMTFCKNSYYIQFKSINQFDYLCRQDDIAFEKYLLWTYDIKPFLWDLIRLRFGRVRFHLIDIINRLIDIHYLK